MTTLDESRAASPTPDPSVEPVSGAASVKTELYAPAAAPAPKTELYVPAPVREVPKTEVYLPASAPQVPKTEVYVARQPGPAAPPRTEVYAPAPAQVSTGTEFYSPGQGPGRRPSPGASPAPEGVSATTGGDPRPGDRVRQYELIRQLGIGGMGEVFLARDTKLGRRVAIKFLHTQDPALVERFLLEARATARCGHENIVTIYEADTHQGRPYMVLEYLQGKTLADLIAGEKALPPSRAVELLLPVLRALARAHEEGIVHRDLKPDNVISTDSGVIKVLDFGIAKVLGGEGAALEPRAGGRSAAGGSPGLTQHGMTIGTLQYMSPEQWRADDIDHRTDLWAVGIMLFRMLSGRHPLHGLTDMEMVCVADPREAMPSLVGEASGVPQRLAEVVDGCLAKDPAKRPADALALLQALEPFMPGRVERELRVDESPYAGLNAFQEVDADRFFGRAHEIAVVVNRLRDQPVLAIVGPSGIGKSSFVRAGVVPVLKRLGESWEPLVLRPGRSPLAALASALSPMGAASAPGPFAVADELQQQRELLARIGAEPGYAGTVLRAYARRQGRKVLLFVDQFEELFTLVPDARERLAFTAALAGIADDATSPVRLVLSVRSDFLERVSEDPRFMAELGQGLYFLPRPSDDGLREALTVPAEMAGYRFESPEMVEALIRDLRSTHGALSLLQFTASQLWEARDRARKVLTQASYDAIGGIAGALAGYADRVVDGLPPRAREAARELFLMLVTPERTRAIVSVEELVEPHAGRDLEHLVEQLAQARLLVLEKSDRGSTAEIVHESLIHAWPTLRRWLDESGEDAQFLERLRAGSRQWGAHGRNADLLWRGELAEEARRFSRRGGRELPELQRSFLEAVLRHQARAARRRRMLVIGGGTALSLVVVASLVAVVVIRGAQQEAVRQAEIARTAEVAARERAAALQVKERERAEAARRAEAASGELAVRNAELQEAVESAELATGRATEAQLRAEQAAAVARQLREQADGVARQLAVRLDEEKERVRRLKEQFGSPIADRLPR